MISARISLLFKVALCLLAFCTSARSEEIITSISGRRVPVRLVQQHFVNQLNLSDHKKNIIYELTEQQVLLGPGLHLDLRTETRPVKTSSQHSFTVTLNGKSREAPSTKFITLRAKSYDVIIDEGSRRIVSVTGNGIVLAPLHRKSFPGIFVNRRVFAAKEKYDLSVDPETAEKQQDVVGGDAIIATKFGRSISEHQSGGSCASGTTHYLEIAVAYDNSFCALYGDEESTATEALQGVVDRANVAYAENTCVQLALVHVEAHCQDSSDPYRSFTSFSAQQILNGFRQIWITSRTNVARDSAYLITGFEDGTSVAGIAGTAAACNTFGGYGWIEGPNAFIFAHEVGHTLGGRHTAQGIMGAVSTSNSVFSFSSVSVQEFISYLDNNSGSSCVETTRPRGRTAPPSSTNPSSTTPTTPQIPTVNTPPTTNVPPVSSGETCESGFLRTRALVCRGQTLTATNFRISGRTVGQLRIRIAQQYGQFQMMYRTTNDLYISQYRDSVTTESGGSLGSYTSPDLGTQQVETKWEANEISKPSGTTTCCGQALNIEVDVVVCVEGRSQPICGRISNRFRRLIRCGDVCRGNTSGAFVPMSTSQRCPSCT